MSLPALIDWLLIQVEAHAVDAVLIGGNHDSVTTLGESRALLARLSVKTPLL